VHEDPGSEEKAGQGEDGAPALQFGGDQPLKGSEGAPYVALFHSLFSVDAQSISLHVARRTFIHGMNLGSDKSVKLNTRCCVDGQG
jgi:hypothetical protein